MTSHAILSPSGANMWFDCPGSLWANKNLPEGTSEYAREGTTAHILAEYCLKFDKKNAGEMVGMRMDATNNPPVDAEMAEYIQGYVETIRGILDACAKVDAFEVEQKLEFTELLDLSTCVDMVGLDYKVEPMFGTADVIIIADGELQVHDLKYGQGVTVVAQGNTQLRIYALAAYYFYSLIYDIERVSIHIHQVRKNSYTSEDITLDELLAFGEKLKEKASWAYLCYINGANEDDFSPSESACRFCKSSSTCPALAKHVAETVAGHFVDLDKDISEQLTTTVDISELPNAELANKFKAVKLIESWCKSIQARAQAELQQGNGLPGYKLVYGRLGNRAWSSEEEAETALKSFRLKQEEMYKRSLISPTEATKIFKDNPKRLSKLETIIVRAEGKPTVVVESDKRPAIEINISNAFEDLTKEDNNDAN